MIDFNKLLWEIVNFPRYLNLSYSDLNTVTTWLWIISIFLFLYAVVQFVRHPPRPKLMWVFLFVVSLNIILDSADILDQFIWNPRFIMIEALITLFLWIEVAARELKKIHFLMPFTALFITVTSCFMLYASWVSGNR